MSHKKYSFIPRLAISLLFVMILLHVSPSFENEAPASQPSQPKANITCNEWDKNRGKEGLCTMQLDSGLWELNYYKEGTPKYSFKKGELKNLVLLFHPKDSSHKFFDWWPEVVGPGKAIDTNKYIVLSLGMLGDGSPQKGNPMLLTMDAMIEAQWTVLQYIFQNPKVLLAGGPSMGGDNAVQLAYRKPGLIQKLFTVGGYYHTKVSEKPAQELGPAIKAILGITKQEMAKGPYKYWTDDAKISWWREVSVIGINRAYDENFYRNPENMKKEGLDPKTFKDPKQFKDAVINSWANWYLSNVDPHWYGSQLQLYAEVQTNNEDAKNLPNEILDIRIKQDETDDPKLVLENRENLKKFGKKVTPIDVDDSRGHLACCQVENMNKDILTAVKNFLD